MQHQPRRQHTTSLIGRTLVSDPLETPFAGVTVTTLGFDSNGNTTGCMGHSTVGDAAGNFLPTTTTSPSGKCAGVNLVLTRCRARCPPRPWLVHLPRIDNVEIFLVQ
jgi:hypothetical protein